MTRSKGVNMKECKRCSINKSKDNFCKMSSNKDGLDFYCRDCKVIKRREQFRSKKGVITRIWNDMWSHSKQRGTPAPELTKAELTKYLMDSNRFHKYFQYWVESGYLPRYSKAPSVDRLNDDAPYSLSNIQLTTWERNNLKNNLRTKYIKRLSERHTDHVKVTQIDRDTDEVVKVWDSVESACRAIPTLYQGNIYKVCVGKRNTAGGFKWKYTDS